MFTQFISTLKNSALPFLILSGLMLLAGWLWQNAWLFFVGVGVLGVATWFLLRQISQQNHTELSLDRRLNEMTALYETALEIDTQTDLSTLLAAIVRRAAELLNTRMGSLFLMQPDNQSLRTTVAFNQDQSYIGIIIPLGEGLAGKVAQTSQPITVSNYQKWDGRWDSVTNSNVSRVLGVPLKQQEQVIGVINVFDNQYGRFDDDDIKLLTSFAAFASKAIEKNEKFEKERHRTAKLETLQQTMQSLVALRNVEKLAHQISEHALALFNGSSAGVFIYRAEKNIIELVGLVGKSAIPIGFQLAKGEGLAGRVWAEMKPIAINDYLRWQGKSPKWDKDFAIMGTPIIWRKQFLGVITVTNNRQNPFTDEDLYLHSLFVMQAAIAIQNAQLFEQAGAKIAERKEAEKLGEELIAELEAKNVELERFAYTVSHDLKSPLITIQGFMGYLEEDIVRGNQDNIARDIQFIRNATEQMQSLLDTILELSRIGRMKNQSVHVPFNEIVDEALERLAGNIFGKNVQIEVMPDLPSVYVDKIRIIEVVQNLVDNSLKYMGDQSSPAISIGLADMDGEPCFFIKDNGIGIAEKYHDKIFRLFERLDSTTEGTGIGLALVKRIVEVHNGRIWIESQDDHPGTTFYFTLPLQITDQPS